MPQAQQPALPNVNHDGPSREPAAFAAAVPDFPSRRWSKRPVATCPGGCDEYRAHRAAALLEKNRMQLFGEVRLFLDRTRLAN
jgi:hypothetical protein